MNHQQTVESQYSLPSKTDFNMNNCNYFSVIKILPKILYSFLILLLPSLSIGQSDIAGKVWFDTNANGLIDPLENTFPNIPVFLITCSGQFVQATQTNGTGDYGFTNVADGNYKLFFNTSGLSSTYVFTIIDTNLDNNALANGYTDCNVIDVNTSDEYILNAGLTILTSIGDKIWNDLNGNGLQNNGEPGLNNVTVNLQRASDDAIIATTTSNASGSYSFNNILPGNYFISFLPSAIYQPTIINNTNPASNSDITDANGPNTTDVFTLTAGINNFNLDAGFYECAKICGFMYYDGNFNNTLSINENGINGLQVRLWRIESGDTLLYLQQYTGPKPGSPSDDGYYEFCVPPGKYFVEVSGTLPDDIIAGLPFVGNNPLIFNSITHANGINTTNNIDVISGDEFCHINGGFYCTGSIVTRVWFDTNQNGVQDDADYGMGNTAVFLYDQYYNLIEFGFTTPDGYYVFDSLSNGSYFIYSNIEPEFSYTIPHMGEDDLDSDIDGTMGEGTTALFVIDSCQHYNHVDAGIAFGVLPVIWGDISASKNKNSQTVTWNVLSENNVSHYIVTKNKSGNDTWENIGTVKSIDNKSDGKYHFDDYDTYYTSDIHYRVIAVDYDGKTLKSKIVSLYPNDKNLKFNVHPNPASELIEIKISGTERENQELSVSIYNSLGMDILNFPVDGVSTINIPVSELTPGIYRVTLKSNYKILQSNNVIIAR